MLLDKHVGARCLSVLLGVGYNRLHSVCHGHVDLRYRAFGFVPCTKIRNLPAMLFPVAVSKLLEALIEVRRRRANKRRKVDMHLMKLYQDAAGMLPDKPLVFYHHTCPACNVMGFECHVLRPTSGSQGFREEAKRPERNRRICRLSW